MQSYTSGREDEGIFGLGIDTFVLSGYPHLEETYQFAELVFPLLPLTKETPST
ncbi:hypothetical protein [Bacillus sp. ISL-7]|uniref:hypothetical protein n=1 Tax=Bacillus sp. ISL-7 TaxID=2819136 RepID=UPI001BE72DDE|nr:hypothetical protein [Bacillus sp. ISL-7]